MTHPKPARGTEGRPPANGAAQEPSTALAQRDDASLATLAFEPGDVAEAWKLARVLVGSGLLPKAIRTQSAAFAVLLTGRELGLTTMQSYRSIHVIEGRPTLAAELMVALVKRSPDCVWFRLDKSDDAVATYSTLRKGDDKPTTLSYTIEQAKRAGLAGKDTYVKHPSAMLRARASAGLCRAVYPDTMLGIHATEEMVYGGGAAVYDGEIVEVNDEPEPPAQPDHAASLDPEREAIRAEAPEPRSFTEPAARTMAGGVPVR